MADNEEKLILSADTARFKRGLEQAAKTLSNLSDLTGRTDRELRTLETRAQKAATSLKNLSASVGKGAGKSPFAGWSKEAQVVLKQLKELEAQQKKVNDRKVGQAQLPASLQGRNSAGQFTARDVKNLSDAELKQISDTIANKEMTLSRAVQRETQRRAKMRQDEARAAQNAAKVQADAARQAEMAERSRQSAMITGRYALYDISTTYLAVAAGIGAAGVVSVKTAADFESAFTNVERTSGEAEGSINGLRQSLIDISTSTPTNFADVAGIATLGQQLGIGRGAIVEFTKSVQEFSLVSGMTAEATATAFGSLATLLNVNESEFENLGSAIALVARTSVSTEEEIISLTTRLAASAHNAGFSAQEVVALSGALASLRVAPERAQGVMEVYFNSLNTALSQGGAKLDLFAGIVGVTSDKVEGMLQKDPAGFFRAFSAGLNQLDDKSRTAVLDELGLAGIRAGEVFGRVASNLDEFDKAMNNSNKGYAEGTELNRQYQMVLNDLNSQFGILVNSIMAFFASVGQAGALGLPEIIGAISQLVQMLTAWINTPLGGWITRTTVMLGAVLVGIIAYRGAIALATASTWAFTTAMLSAGRAGGGMGLSGLVGALRNYTTMARAAKTETTLLAGAQATSGRTAAGAIAPTRGLTTAVMGFMRATVVLGIIATIIQFITDLRGSMLAIAPAVDVAIDALITSFQVIARVTSAITGLLSVLPLVGGFFNDINKASTNWAKGSEKQATMAKKAYRDWANTLPGAASGVEQVADATVDMGDAWEQGNVELDTGADNLDDVGDSAADAAEEIRTLVDYANDLQGVMSRAFDIRFGGQNSLDVITKSFSDMRKASADARAEIRTLRADILGLQANQKTMGHFLTIAENYGDDLRASEIRADMAKNSADLAKKNADLSAAQQKNSKTLKGNSDAAIANRQSLSGLVQQYQDHIVELAGSGLSTKELARRTEELRQDFIKQATQLGFNRTEVGKYAKSFDDMKVAINGVPRNITVNGNVNPALQALAEFNAKLKETRAGAAKGGGIKIPASVSGINIPNMDPAGEAAGKKFKHGFKRGANGAFLYSDGTGTFNPAGELRFVARGGFADQAPTKPMHFARGGMVPGRPPARKSVDNVPAMLRSREFVVREQATRHYGPDFMNAVNQMKLPRFAGGGSASGGSGGGGGMTGTIVVELSPYDRRLLARAGDVQLSIGADQIARASGSENVNSFRRGRG